MNDSDLSGILTSDKAANACAGTVPTYHATESVEEAKAVVEMSRMSAKVNLQSNGESFAGIEADAAYVEFSKDESSPACPHSWTWGLWYDGNYLEGSCDESSLDSSMTAAIESIGDVIEQLTSVRDYLVAFGAFGKEPGDMADFKQRIEEEA